MDFGEALNALKTGQKVSRSGWNGKGMYLFYNPGSKIVVSEGRPLASAFPVGTPCNMSPYIMMKTADHPGITLVPWLASRTDILATDWNVV